MIGKRTWIAAVLMALGTHGAAAKVPVFAAKCPTGITVDTNPQGGGYVNGNRARVRSINANAYELRSGRTIISVALAGGDLLVSYTGPNRANGICEVLSRQAAEPTPARARPGSSSVPPRDRSACLQAVRRETRNRTVVILSSEFSEANNAIVVGVGPQRAKWRCLVKRGKVGEVMSLTDEGAL